MSWLIILQLSSALVHGYDTAGFDGWYQPVPHRPVDIITDVINDLGARILQQYTGHGNVAFSPTGVGFVLAALYEGSAGRGRQQIVDALGLPRDRDITRIGFRDIHRRLRTYLNADGFLGGLTLNQENTKLRPEYEEILRFYGFDLSVPEDEGNETTAEPETTTDQPVTETPVQDETTVPETTIQDESTTLGPTMQDETTTPEPTVQEESTTPGTMVQDETTISETTPESTQRTERTNEAVPSTTSDVELIGTMNATDVQERLTQTTSASTILMNSPPVTLTGQTATSSGDSKEVPTTMVVTSETPMTTVSIVQPTTMVSSMTKSTSGETMANLRSTLVRTALASTPGTSVLTEGTEATTQAVSEPPTTSMTTTTVASTTTGVTTVILATDVSMTAASVNDMEVTTSSTIPNTTRANLATGATTNGPPADENTVLTDSTNNQTAPSEMGSTDLPDTTAVTGETVSSTSSARRRRKRGARSPRGFFSSYPDEGIWMQDLGIWKPYSTNLGEASVRDSTEISFLVNGCDVSSVTASRYFAVLPFAYFPSLHAVALEFPLDDPRYNILLLMATDRRDTYRLARDLGGKSLRLLRKQLQATWVRATIPSFMLRGFVTLTSFLQRLGIVDVFEPRGADLSLMTPDLGVYARDVQQSIGVNIRNYMKPDRTHSRNGLFERAGPVPFTAVHPFLYFIVDAETSVALIAGRVNDPLNSRIL